MMNAATKNLFIKPTLNSHESHSDLLFLIERIKINKHKQILFNLGLEHNLLYLHGLTSRILKKKIVGHMFKISFASKESK